MTSGQVTDLGQVLHMVGGTAAAFMIFFLPGMLLINAAIVKGPAVDAVRALTGSLTSPWAPAIDQAVLAF